VCSPTLCTTLVVCWKTIILYADNLPMFSNVCDRVDPVVLAQKLSKLKLPEYIFNLLLSFLTGRSHTTRCSGIESCPLPINLSITQGSILGPSLYITFESDLKPISNTNEILKYADDTNLLVPACTDVQLSDEFDATLNRQKLTR
jgi:Reverse transcriptase (RNA-dependent DNA polymerase)